MLPIGVGHAHAFEATIDHTLTAIDAAVHVIFEDEAFGGAVERDQLDGFGGAIFHAQAATCASGWGVMQIAAETFRGGCLFKGIELGTVLFEQRSKDIFEHSAELHAVHPFSKIMTSSWISTRIAPKRHQSPTVWSMRRRVSVTCSMDMIKSKTRVLRRNSRMPFTPPR